jgi:hypothetical protein
VIGSGPKDAGYDLDDDCDWACLWYGDDDGGVREEARKPPDERPGTASSGLLSIVLKKFSFRIILAG